MTKEEKSLPDRTVLKFLMGSIHNIVIFFLFFFLFLVALGFEVRVSHLLDRYFTS
jgi:hypothetical protein